MEQVSTLLRISFIVITLLTAGQFYRAANRSKTLLIFTLLWMALQLAIAETGFYNKPGVMPPRLMFQLLPALILIIVLFVTTRGRNFIDGLDIKQLVLLHTIRIPVEIVLYCLFMAKAIPQIMTFEGRNFDILAGLTAPLIYYFGFIKKNISKKIILAWNLISLGLLINIILIALLSSASPLQQFAITETNIALGHSPFNWLPGVVVPIVLLSQLAGIRQLIVK